MEHVPASLVRDLLHHRRVGHGQACGAARFTRTQVDELIAFANRADVLDDRARIANGLHHGVIHQLISIGMSLQSVLSLVPRLHGAISRLDETVRQLRAVVFDLQSPVPECPLRNDFCTRQPISWKALKSHWSCRCRGPRTPRHRRRWPTKPKR